MHRHPDRIGGNKSRTHAENYIKRQIHGTPSAAQLNKRLIVAKGLRNHRRGRRRHQQRNKRRNRKRRQQNLAGEQSPRHRTVEDGGNSRSASARQQQSPGFQSGVQEFRHVGTDRGAGQGDRRFESGGSAETHADSAGDEMGIGMLFRNVAGPVGCRNDHIRKTLVVAALHEQFHKNHAQDDPDHRHRGRQPHHPRTFRMTGKFMEIIGDVFQCHRRESGQKSDEDAQQQNIPLMPHPLAQDLREAGNAQIGVFQQQAVSEFHYFAPAAGFFFLSRFIVRISFRNSSRFLKSL